MSRAIDDVIAERTRQIEVEGWTDSHDDDHSPGELADAGATYALEAGLKLLTGRSLQGRTVVRFWPWDWKWWKPKAPRRDTVGAA